MMHQPRHDHGIHLTFQGGRAGAGALISWASHARELENIRGVVEASGGALASGVFWHKVVGDPAFLLGLFYPAVH